MPPLRILLPLAVVYAAAIGFVLYDLARHPVRLLPKWVWALIVAFVSFPLGAILYAALGRVPYEDLGEDLGGEPGDTSSRPTQTAPHAALPPPSAQAHTASADSGLAVRARGAVSAETVRSWAVVTRGLTKRYGDVTALEGIDLRVPRGSTFGLIGPNGAGKTTLLAILTGLRKPTDGTFELADRRVAMLPDTPQFEPWLTAREVVDLARALVAPDLPIQRVDAVLTQAGLAQAADRRVGGFSRGMLQRLGLAACLVGDPEVLILDEPSSALDPAGRREVLDLIGRLAQAATVVLSTHVLADVQQVCDEVAVLDRGRLRFQGPLTELLERAVAAVAIQVRPPARRLVDLLQRESWVESVTERAPGRLLVRFNDALLAESRLPGLLARAEVRLVAVNPATDLESAFLDLMT